MADAAIQSDKIKAIEAKKCITPEFRMSFPNLSEPKGFEGGEEKYGLTMLFEKAVDIKGLKQIVFNAISEKWGPDRTKWPKGLRLPFRDGDTEENYKDKEGYAGCIFVRATSKRQPGMVDKNLKPILNIDEAFYGGCYARAEVLAFPYDRAGNKGVALSLQNVQKLRDGKPFSGRKAAQDVFDAVEDNTSVDDPFAYENTQASDGLDALGLG